MEKKNKGLIVLVIILSLLVVGLGGFIVYDKVLSDNSNNKDNNNLIDDKETITEINDEYDEKIDIITKAGILLDKININYLLSKKNVVFNEMNNQEKLWLMFLNYNRLTNAKTFEELNSNELLNGLKQYFGNDFHIIFEDFDVWKYDSTTKRFESIVGKGYSTTIDLKKNMISYNKDENYYYITYKPMLYVNEEGCEYDIDFKNANGETIYTHIIQHNEDNSNYICSSNDIEKDLIDKVFKQQENNLNNIKFKFKLENNNLILIGFESES